MATPFVRKDVLGRRRAFLAETYPTTGRLRPENGALVKEKENGCSGKAKKWVRDEYRHVEGEGIQTTNHTKDTKKERGSRIEDRGSKNEDRGSRIEAWL
jgi:hypothetical protein